jgi:hypothetical protein
MHLGVLRVLNEQTLEISYVVKDPTFPDPSLVTEVKYSPSPFYISSIQFQEHWLRQGILLEVFCRARVHPS